MIKGAIFLISLLMISATQLQANQLNSKAANNASVRAKTILHSLNNPAGLRAFESFSGKDFLGKDGPMSKIGMDLSLVFQEHRDFKIRGGEKVLRRSFSSSLTHARVKDQKIVIDVVASGNTDTLIQELKIIGMENISVFGRMVSGLLPIASLEKIAAISTMKFARPAYAKAGTGSVTSQGDAALISDDARTSFGVDGAGITIGTLSDSYDCIGGAAADIVSNDLPVNIVVLADESSCVSGSDEGRAMMQVIHDIAPGANQVFHTAFDGEASYANGIVELAAAGSDIINDDVFYYAEPMFQDGVISQAVDSVHAMGVAYFSAAGNQSSDSYEASYVSSGLPGFTAGSVQHDFDTGAGVDSLMEISIPAGTQAIFVLQWQDPFYSVSGAPGAQTDMDIILHSSVGQALAGGIDANIGGDAVEIFSFINSTATTNLYQLSIDHVAGQVPGKVKFVYFGNVTINQYATNSSTSYGHSIASGGQGVGAASYSNTPDYGVTPPVIESFSSKGGTTILFDTSGNPVNQVRQKPDFVAPNGGDNTFFGSDYDANGLPNFFGTSAAASHAAGMAALLKEFDNTLIPDDLYTAMQSTAVDMDVAGFDFLTGHGLVQATLALASLDDDSDTVPDSQDNCPNDANITQDDFDIDGLGDVCDPDDDNDGVIDINDAFPFDAAETLDTDGDGTGNNADLDDDNDGVSDIDEINAGSDPLDPLSIPDPDPATADGDLAPLGSPDGFINAADYLIAQRIVLGNIVPTALELSHGDLYPPGAPDGVINMSDLILIQGLLTN